MNRLWAAGAILLILIAVCTASVFMTQSITVSIAEQIEQISLTISEEDRETAASLCKETIDEWQVHHAILCTYMSHIQLEEIDRSLSALSAYLEYGEEADIQAECNRIIEMMSHLQEAELPYIQNIL